MSSSPGPTVYGGLAAIAVVVLAGVSTRFLTILLASPFVLLVGSIAYAIVDVYLSAQVERIALKRLRAAAEDRAPSVNVLAGSRGSQRRKVPPLNFTSAAAWSVVQTRAAWETSSATSRSPFPSATPAVTQAVDSLFDLIIRDFVNKWYSSISDSPVFPSAVETTIRDALRSVAERVATVDWSDLVVGKILPLVTTHIDTFRTAELALRGQGTSARLTESDELDLFLAEQYAKLHAHSKLHPAVDVASPNSKPAEEAWLSALIGDVLPFVLPDREYESGAVRTIVRELVACAVVHPIIELLSDPDFWNKIIDEKAGAAIRDQQMVTQFREALDKQGSSISPLSVVAATPNLPSNRKKRTEEISARTGHKQFDSWSRAISKSNNLLDTRRLRSDLAAQIRKIRSLVDGREPQELVQGATVTEWLAHAERLSNAKRKAEKRIGELGGMAGSSRDSILGDPRRKVATNGRLRDILLQPTSLSYFMEFQERRGRSLQLQFWLLVEGLKDPLVDDTSDLVIADVPASPTAVSQTRGDVSMIWDAYIEPATVQLDARSKAIIRKFLDALSDAPVSCSDLRRVRQAVFSAQAKVFLEMEEDDFPAFAKTDLYFKALADLPQATSSQVDVYALTSALQTRPRASSDPPRPPLIQSLAQSAPDLRQIASPSIPRPSSPPLPLSKAVHMQRKDTAPPQVTYHAAFDQQRPSARRSESAGSAIDQRGRKTSAGSLEGAGTTHAGRDAMTDSLDFLMASPRSPDVVARSPLFDDDGVDDVDGRPRSSDGANGHLHEDDFVQIETIEAIQDALTSILASDIRSAGQNSRVIGATSPTVDRADRELRASSVSTQPLPPSLDSPAPRVVSGSSTGSRRKVFDDDEDMDQVESEDSDPDFDPKNIRVAAPGDLQLPAEIARLAAVIDKLQSQEAVVGAMVRKAELTGRASELKILIKSRESLRRELRTLSFQKGQYELQESENKLVPGRTTVSISGTTIGQTNGQSFQLYLVEVRPGADTSSGSGWLVTKRYSEFATLHSTLKDKFPIARQLDFPGKRLVTSYNDAFIEQRRRGLEKYLRYLIRDPAVCQSVELRAFLSQQNISLPKLDSGSSKSGAAMSPAVTGQSLVRSIYRTLTSGIDEVLGTGPTSIMDTVIQRLSQQAAELSGLGSAGVQDEDLVGKLLLEGDVADIPLDSRVGGGDEGLTYFTAPICDLFVTLFSLKDKNNWLRRQAILIILQQVLGGTIERKFRDGVRLLFGQDQLVNYISALKEGLWPGGQLKPKEAPRTSTQKAATRDSANRKLSALMPDVAANLIGRANARQGARQLFAVLQNRRLNRHLIYSVVDEVFAVLFPETVKPRNTPHLPQSVSAQQARGRSRQ